ncbi:hypothetical protein [Flavobacterium sp. XGLA_31]|uniref:hypothetical protein n=1 Tax=Flavobacterium sp. XGLA_31 TaxID=3447666 RepID=UPI003F32F0C1
MKTSIIFLGLIAVTFTTNTNAANVFNTQNVNQQELVALCADSLQQENQLLIVNQQFSKETIENNGSEEVVFNPNSVITTAYAKSTAEVTAEDKLITEAKEDAIQPLCIETTLQDRIAEDNAIIESTAGNELYALDFEKINRAVKTSKVPNHNLAVSVDLKL